MKNETWIYKNKKYVKATKWDLFWRNLKYKFTKWKLIDTSKYDLIPWENKKRYFILSPKEYANAEEIYNNKGTISYEFYPCAGIGWGVKVHVLKTKEIIDISDINTW